jgi:catalase
MSKGKRSTSDGEKITTTDAGIPASSDEFSLTVGPGGPILLQDHYLIQKMAQFNRERVPERVVHAKGGGAHGYFEVTADVTPSTRAKFLGRVGKRTPVFIRFSTVAGALGSPDTKPLASRTPTARTHTHPRRRPPDRRPGHGVGLPDADWRDARPMGKLLSSHVS